MPGTSPPVPVPSRVAARLLAAIASLLPGIIFAGALGMVSDNTTKRLAIFDAEVDRVTASVATAPGRAMADCSVTSDERTGFSTSAGSEITVIELDRTGRGAHGRHKNVAISNLGLDMSLSPDDSLLVLAGGGELMAPLAVIDTRLQREVTTASLFADHTSVEFCDNGTLLVTTTHGEFYDGDLDNALYDARIDGHGGIELKGHRLSSGVTPNNSACAPGSFSGVLLDREGGVTSFTLPGLQSAQAMRLASGPGVAAAFSPRGHMLFVRTTGAVEAFRFDPLSGAMTRAWTRPVPGSLAFYGIEQIALHPDGRKLYVDGGNGMMILDPETGARTGGVRLGSTTGICFANAGPFAKEKRLGRFSQADRPAGP